jgi:hypothetical protein
MRDAWAEAQAYLRDNGKCSGKQNKQQRKGKYQADSLRE